MVETEEEKKKKKELEAQRMAREQSAKAGEGGTFKVGEKTNVTTREGTLELPEGIKAPNKFNINPQTQPSFEVGNKSVSQFSGNKEVSSADYYGSITDNINATRASRGEAPLTLQEKNKIIMDSIINSPGNAGTAEYQQRAASGQIQLEGQPNTQAAQQIGQQQTSVGLEQQLQAMTPEQRISYLNEANAKGLDIGQALASGVTTALPSVIKGGAVGAAIGAGAGSVIPGAGTAVGAIVGGAVGAIASFVGGVISSLKEQRTGNIQAEFSNLKTSSTNLRSIITDTNSGGDATENIDLFNHQLFMIDQAYSNLHLETMGNLNKFLGKDGTPELEKFENFYAVGGARELLVREMQQAILNPDPSKQLISMSDLEE